MIINGLINLDRMPIVVRKLNNPVMLAHISQPDLYLASSILLETFSTICLKNVNKGKIWYLPSYLGYGISFYIFPKAFSKYSLTKAYAIWCGSGIILTTLADIILYSQLLNFRKIIGIISVIFGIFVIKI
jgi:small multidrug resistance pump